MIQVGQIATNSNHKILDEAVCKYVFYILWPFGGWLYSLRSANTRSSYIIFFLFSLLICWHMAPTGLTEEYDDFLGILERFQLEGFSDSEMRAHINHFFDFSVDSPKDLYEDILNWFCKKNFGDNYHFFFLFASIPIALCQLGSLRFVTSDTKYIPGSFIGVIIIALFILPRDIITTQNPRFATAFWYSIFFSLCFFCKEKASLKPLLLLLFAPFFHAAIALYLVFVLIVLLFDKIINLKILERMAIASIFMSFVDSQLLSSMSFDFMPPLFTKWVTGYLSEGSYDRFMGHAGASGFWWVGVLMSMLLKASYMLMAYFIIVTPKDNKHMRFYRFFLWIFLLINCIQFIPELNNRFLNISKVFIVLAWFFFLYGKKHGGWTIKLLAILWLWPIMFRYLYVLGGALSVNTPPDIFYMPLPYLICEGLLW